MNLSEVKDKPISELVEIASELGLEELGRLKKQEIIFRIFKHKASEGTDIYGGGVLEILNDTGLLGFLLILYLVIYLLFNNYKDYKLRKKLNFTISNWIYLAIILSLFTHFFPIKSSGSFFSTYNSAFIFLILGISFGINELKYKKN